MLAIDVSETALSRARARCADLADVEFERMTFPHDRPDGRFDLIVLSEVAYYWNDDDLRRAADWLGAALVHGGDVVLAHWTGETDYPHSGDDAVERLRGHLGGTVQVVMAERRACYRPRSVASHVSLSVLTLVKNRADHLDQLVEGLRRSGQAPDELIVVDMSDVAVRVPVTDFPTTVVRLQTQGLPLAQARNLAAASSFGDRLLFLDVDCIPARSLVAAMDHALSSEDALVCADVRYLRAGQARGDWHEDDLLASGMAHPVRTFPSEGLAEESNAGLFWSLAFGLRRDAFTALGGFDERFTGYGAEDTDFGFRARAAGVRLLFMGGAGAFHQHHGVVDPPLQHFDDILRNARVFHARWGLWPMRGWLDAFERLGLIRLESERLERCRGPSPQEIALATRPMDVPF